MCIRDRVLTIVRFVVTAHESGNVIDSLYSRVGSTVTLIIDSNEELVDSLTSGTVCGVDIGSAVDNAPVKLLIADSGCNAYLRIKITKKLGITDAEINSLDANGYIDFSITTKNTFGYEVINPVTKTNIVAGGNNPTGVSVNYDRTAPTVTGFAISSGGNQAMVGDLLYAKESDVVTVTLTTDEDIDTPVISIGDVASAGEITIGQVANNPQEWTATYTMGASANGTDQDGTITVALSYTDLAGNAGTAKTQTDLANVMVYDKVAPSFEINNATTVSISSNNTGSNSSIAAGTRAKVGDNNTLGFIITDAGVIPAPTVSIGGNTEDITIPNPTVAGNVSTYSTSYNAIPDITAGVEAGGDINFLISITDHAGNTSTYSDDNLATAGGTNVVFDKIAPTIGALTIASSTACLLYTSDAADE